MRVLLQRVSRAEVVVEGEKIASIGPGLLLFLGVSAGDSQAQAQWLAEKVTALRIFDDAEGRMNLSVSDIGGEILVVSQFTLCGDCRRGRRPGFERAAKPAEALALYEYFQERLSTANIPVQSGCFGAHMEVSLLNDGPVTFVIDAPDGSL